MNVNARSSAVSEFDHPSTQGRSRLRRLVFRFLQGSGLLALWQLLVQRKRPAILCYHDPSPERFAQHLTMLQRYFTIIPLQDYVQARLHGTTAALPSNALIITMDDGHARNFTLLNLIARRQVPVSIMLTSGVVDTHRHFWWSAVTSDGDLRHMRNASNEERLGQLQELGFTSEACYSTRQSLSRDEIKTMSSYVDFQAHTRFHPVLPRCTDAEAEDEIAGCKAELAEKFGCQVYALAYPHGYYSERDMLLTKQAGFLCALTVDEGLNTDAVDLYRLRRIYMPDDAEPEEAVIKASGLWSMLARLVGRRAEHGYQHPVQ